MGRAGIEPATHGFSVHKLHDSNCCKDNHLDVASNSSAAPALHISDISLRFLVDAWPELSPKIRSAIVVLAKSSKTPETERRRRQGNPSTRNPQQAAAEGGIHLSRKRRGEARERRNGPLTPPPRSNTSNTIHPEKSS